MSYRYMRLIVFFDLPTATSQDLKVYRKFRKSLIKLGFYMFQESVYVKMVLNANVGKSVTAKVEQLKPDRGLVQMISVTERQFQNIVTFTGEQTTDVLDTDERTVIL